MRIFNNRGTNLELPLGNGQKICVPPYGISNDFLPSTNFLVMIASTFGFDELSMIVNGIQEINACSSVSTCNGFVVYSVAEAVERMEKLKEEKQAKKNPAKQEAKKKEEKKEATPNPAAEVKEEIQGTSNP